MVSLWDFLTMLSVVSPLSGAVVGALLQGTGAARLAIAILIGCGMAYFSFTVVRMASSRIDRALRAAGPAAKSPTWLPLAYGANAAWAFVTFPLAIKVSQAVIHLILR